MIELIELNKFFGTTQALSDINLFIDQGEIFGIIGQSGAGKSTLLRCLNLLEKPDSGDIVIDNQIINQLDQPQLNLVRHKMAMIFQQFNLLESKTVYDNIALPMQIQGIERALIKDKIDDVLALVQLENKVNAYPSTLSGGQKQRVAIARALSVSPKILLCDEATSALDPETTQSILALLKQINQLYGITIVLITHEMDVIKRVCHRIAVMKAGKIIESTSLFDAFNNTNSSARAMLYAQLKPELPSCLANNLSDTETENIILQLFFQGKTATLPFISQTSRELALDINILLANIDRFDNLTCGVMVIKLQANSVACAEFIKRCQQAAITVEKLGYVNNPDL